jgi:hypothetical protein
MDKASIAAVMGTVLGLVGGVAGMLWFWAPDQDDAQLAHLESRIGDLNNTLSQYGEEHARLTQKLEEERRKSAAVEGLSADHERLAGEKADAEAKVVSLRAERDDLRARTTEQQRQHEARIRRLERVLSEHGIVDHLTDEEVAGHVQRLTAEFRAAMEAGEKSRLLDAFHELQRYGPRAWDRVIELWYELPLAADDESEAPPVEFTREELEGLISQVGVLRMALSDREVPEAFRVYALLSVRRFAGHDDAELARLAGNVLLNSEDFEAEAAVTALADLNDPAGVRFLADFAGTDRRSTAARVQAMEVLARFGTAEAMEALKDAAEHDPEESVRDRAKELLAEGYADVAGVRVTWVDPEGQAALAGIRVGDVLTRYNDVEVLSISALVAERDRAEGAESVKAEIHRDGETLELTLAPGALGLNGVSVRSRE